MKIVHFDQMFHPEFGDQINLISKFQVKQGHDVTIVTADYKILHPRFKRFADNSNMSLKDEAFTHKYGVQIIRLPIYRYISGRAIFKAGFKKVIDDLKPDVLFCHYNDSLIGMYFILISQRLNYPVVFDSHMLRMASKNKFKNAFRYFYRKILAPKINREKLKVIRTQDEDYINTELGINKELTPFLSFGSDTSLFYPDNYKRLKLREELSLGNDFIILYTGQINDAKGINFFINAMNKVNFNNKKVTLLMVGHGHEKYVNEILDISNNKPYNFKLVSTKKYEELPKYYNMADFVVFPKQSSLSFYDAQACGKPVLAEKNNINIDRLRFDNGLLYNINDIEDLIVNIEDIINMNKEMLDFMAINAFNFVKNEYDYESISKKYTNILECEVFRHKEKLTND